MIGRQLTPLPRSSFKAISFKVVERSGNYIFVDDTPPTVLRVRVVSYALGAHKVSIESFVVET